MDQTGLLMVWEDQEPPAWEPAADTVNQKAPEKTGFHTLILAQYTDLFFFLAPRKYLCPGSIFKGKYSLKILFALC